MDRTLEERGVVNTYKSISDDLMEIYQDAELHAPMLAEGKPYVLQYGIKGGLIAAHDYFRVEKQSCFVITVIIFDNESDKRLWMEDQYVKEDERFWKNKVDKNSLFYEDKGAGPTN